MFEIIPNWHPVFVHFTVALLSIATLMKLAALFVRDPALREQWQTVARWNLWLGAGITIITVIMGWYAYNSVNHDVPSHAAMTEHRNWALATTVVFLAIAIWSMLCARAGKETGIVVVIAMLVATGMLASTAWHGGEVVYRYGLGVMSLPKTDSHEHAPGISDDHHVQGSAMTPAIDPAQGDQVMTPGIPGQDEDQTGTTGDNHQHDDNTEGSIHTHADGTTERH